MSRSLASRVFGRLLSGQTVEAWTLRGTGGLELETITYGGIITRLLVPDQFGRMTDVVLGFDKLDSYLADHSYIGPIVGRVAGRITNARFRLEGKTYELAPNHAPNHLHGGAGGFSTKVWTATPVNRPDGAPCLRLSYHSRDGEEGYPGNVDVAVTYTLAGDNVLFIETEAVTDRPTPFSLTQHTYFNLAGEGSGGIADHQLQVHADHFVPTDERLTLLDEAVSVQGRDNDFRAPRTLGNAMPLLSSSHGDLYILRKSPPGDTPLGLVPAARLVHPGGGLALEVSSTETHLQFYTGVYLDGALTGKRGVRYAAHAGVCLECQGYPNGANAPSMGDIILRPRRPRSGITAYTLTSPRS
jgi:aldose 1-epimerase